MREGEHRRRAFFRVVVTGGVLIAAAAVVLYSPWLHLFDLREIEINGNERVSIDQILRLVGFHRGDNLLRVPVKQATKSLEELPWIEEAGIEKAYPHRVRILIEERAPIAVMTDPQQDDSLFVIAEGGLIADKMVDKDSPFVLVSGIRTSARVIGGRVLDEKEVSALESIHRNGLHVDPFRSVDFSDKSSVTMSTSDGLKVALGPVEGIEDRIDALASLILIIDLSRYESIDLRFGGEAILVPRKVVN